MAIIIIISSCASEDQNDQPVSKLADQVVSKQNDFLKCLQRKKIATNITLKDLPSSKHYRKECKEEELLMALKSLRCRIKACEASDNVAEINTALKNCQQARTVSAKCRFEVLD